MARPHRRRPRRRLRPHRLLPRQALQRGLALRKHLRRHRPSQTPRLQTRPSSQQHGPLHHAQLRQRPTPRPQPRLGIPGLRPPRHRHTLPHPRRPRLLSPRRLRQGRPAPPPPPMALRRLRRRSTPRPHRRHRRLEPLRLGQRMEPRRPLDQRPAQGLPLRLPQHRLPRLARIRPALPDPHRQRPTPNLRLPVP